MPDRADGAGSVVDDDLAGFLVVMNRHHNTVICLSDVGAVTL